MKIFISHKWEDSVTATQISGVLRALKVPHYLDVLDSTTISDAKMLTEHIKANLNKCSDVIVVMSGIAVKSQWVPFEVGMSTQADMPTVTFLSENVELPEFLSYWPRLKRMSDIEKYVTARRRLELDAIIKHGVETSFAYTTREISEFYSVLKKELR